MKTCHWIMTLLGMAFLAGCSKPARWEGLFASQPVPEQQPLQLHYVVEGDVYEGTFDNSKRSVVFVVLWKAKQGGDVSRGADNCLRSIHDQRVIPDYSKRAVYALQSDYKIRPLALSEAERDVVFESLMNRGTVWTNTFWSEKIWSKLSIVEQSTR